mgnify:CR=1 FL=1
MGNLYYCFEEDHVKSTLAKSRKSDLAVIDTDGIPASTIKAAVSRGVYVYGYINAGALEGGRSYYQKYKHLRLAQYDGWPGEYWIDPTAQEWQDHLLDLAKKIKATGAIGAYFDNTDIYYEVRHLHKAYDRKIPSQTDVYIALRDVIKKIVNNVGLIVMPNGGDDFVRRFFEYDSGKTYIKTINQEGCLYEGFKAQPKSERVFRAEYMDWAKKKGLYVRGIEYCKKPTEIAKCKAYYKLHGWQGLYISKHTDLKGD